MIRPSRRRLTSRALALALFAAVAALPGLVLTTALDRRGDAIRAETASLRAQTAALRARLAGGEARRQAVNARIDAAEDAGVFVAAPTPQLAFGALQSVVGAAIRSAEGELVSIGVAEVEPLGPAARLQLDLVYRAEPSSALRILERLETMRPRVLAERIRIAPARARGLVLAGAAPLLELDVRLAAHLTMVAE